MWFQGLISNINTLWAALIVDSLVKNGLDTYFISPGNRNAPLISALVHHPGALKTSVIDERAAAYCALGHAKATGRPGVVVCTSGTAVANYYPAVIEAARDEVPLVVISADRPPELVGSDANQTIDQTGIFSGFCRHTLYLPCPDTAYSVAALSAKLAHAAAQRSGPVHVNCPFREPLTPEEDGRISHAFLDEARAALIRQASGPEILPVRQIPEGMDAIQRLVVPASTGLVVVGRLDPGEDLMFIRDSIKKLGWPVFFDITSGLKGSLPELETLSVDHPEALRLVQAYGPQPILQLGTALVGKQYYQRRLPAQVPLILVSPRQGVRDPAHRAAIRVQTRVTDFLRALAPHAARGQAADRQRTLLTGMSRLQDALESQITATTFCFAGIAAVLEKQVPAGEGVFLGNSIAIRAFDLGRGFKNPRVRVISNRGVSGIEGNLATSVGFALAAGQRVSAVIGDIAFLHDLNSLLLMHQSRVPVIAVVVNNQGGRIFDRLPMARFPELTTPYMTTPHQMNFKNAAAQFNLAYDCVLTARELEDAYGRALESARSRVIEVRLSAEDDLEVFNGIRNITL